MVEKFMKFIAKSQYRDVLLAIVKDIYEDNLNDYDVMPIEGKKGYYRLRKESIRIIYKKTSEGNRILDIDNRGDIYKGVWKL